MKYYFYKNTFAERIKMTTLVEKYAEILQSITFTEGPRNMGRGNEDYSVKCTFIINGRISLYCLFLMDMVVYLILKRL